MKRSEYFTERDLRALRRNTKCTDNQEMILEKPYFITGSIEVKAGDDALTASLYLLLDVVTGKIRLAFRHTIILFYACRACHELEHFCSDLLKICKEDLYEFFKLRNAVNAKRVELCKSLLQTTPEIEMMVSEFIIERGQFTLDFTPDQIFDINGVTNEWCTSKKLPMNTVDTVTIVFDDKNIPWIKLIQRECSPGKGLYALSGGIVEDGETRELAADREDEEEAKITVSGIKFKKSSALIETLEPSKTFDIRFEYGLGTHGTTINILDSKRFYTINPIGYNIDENIYFSV